MLAFSPQFCDIGRLWLFVVLCSLVLFFFFFSSSCICFECMLAPYVMNKLHLHLPFPPKHDSDARVDLLNM